MAKIYGINGTLTGKQGASVYAVTNGIQTVRQYQPVVANPRTGAQLTQRCKMNTVGRFTKMVPRELLKAMNMANNRKNRSEFNKGLLSIVSVSNPTKDSYVGEITAADIQFSRGAAYVKARVSTPAAISDGALNIGLILAEAEAAGKYAERLVVVVMNPDGVDGPELVKYEDIYFANSTARSVSINLPEETGVGANVILYRIPIDLTEQGMNIATSGDGIADGVITGALDGTAGLVKDFGATVYTANLPFVDE